MPKKFLIIKPSYNTNLPFSHNYDVTYFYQKLEIIATKVSKDTFDLVDMEHMPALLKTALGACTIQHFTAVIVAVP